MGGDLFFSISIMWRMRCSESSSIMRISCFQDRMAIITSSARRVLSSYCQIFQVSFPPLSLSLSLFFSLFLFIFIYLFYLFYLFSSISPKEQRSWMILERLEYSRALFATRNKPLAHGLSETRRYSIILNWYQTSKCTVWYMRRLIWHLYAIIWDI